MKEGPSGRLTPHCGAVSPENPALFGRNQKLR